MNRHMDLVRAARSTLTAWGLGLVCLLGAGAVPAADQAGFRLEEATIASVHASIRSGEITCQGLVEAYIARAKAYDGMCTALVTADGKPVPAARGAMRAGTRVKYPTRTVAASQVLPDVKDYEGLPIEYGRMEPTISDPTVQQQYGMRVGIPNAGQLNALETLNIRGERSVSCKAGCDKPLADGSLPASCPAQCEAFRKLPDAIERALELDRQYGRNPDLEAMPMYCVPFSHKNWYDAKDMRSTGGNDVAYAMDAPPKDSPDIADLRAKGAIIYATATAATTGLTRDDGPEKAKSWMPPGNYAYAAWGGQACNPYDTERVPRGTSSGSGVSVSANLVMCSICEQGSASCKGPGSRNNVVNLLTTRGLMMHGGMNSQRVGDRAGIHCRTVEDTAKVLDAVKGFDSEDMFTAIPAALIPKEPFASVIVKDPGSKPLKGMRVGIVREFMVKHSRNDEAISDQLDAEIKAVLRDRLGAELVESVDPLYADDPGVPNMRYTFQDGFREILAHNVPEYFWQKTAKGELEFAVPGWDVRTVDYAIALALGKAPLSDRINLRRISADLDNFKSPFTVNKYLQERGDSKVHDWASWYENAKWDNDDHRASSKNAVGWQDMRPGNDEISYLELQKVLQLVVQKVMYENDIDVFVNPENTLPPPKIGGPGEPPVLGRGTASCCAQFTALLGGPEIDVPAGYTTVAFEPKYRLSADRKRYVSVAGDVATTLPHPMPLSMMFWAGPGNDATVIRTGSAYEAATKHRKPPPAFGPLPGEPR